MRALLVAKSETKGELAGEEFCGERGPIDAAGAHCCEGRREVPLGETASIFVNDERMVEIGGFGKAEQLLQ